MVRFYYEARNRTAGLTDVKITVTNPSNSVEVNGVVMTESARTGVYYYDFTPTVSGNHYVEMDSASLPKKTNFSYDTTIAASGSGSATYTTTAKVAAFLGLPAFSSSTIPTSTQVDDFILRAQDYIDFRTGHAWRSTTITNEYHNNPESYEDGFLKLRLKHRAIKTLASGSGDKVEVWSGSSWEDWVATKTEGRGNDFWVDYTQGILFLKYWHGYFSNFIRLTYRFGESTIPYDIEQAATLLAAMDVTAVGYRTEARPDVDDDNVMSSWRMRAEDILTRRTEVRFA